MHFPVFSQVTPISDYYIIAGTVYQAPDLGSVLNSRLISTVNHLQQAFEEARQYATYHPSRGYWWDFDKKGRRGMTSSFPEVDKSSMQEDHPSRKKRPRRKGVAAKKEVEKRARDEPSSIFQRRRVDALLELLTRKFPPRVPTTATTTVKAGEAKDGGEPVKGEKELKTEATSTAALKREASSSAGPLSSASKKARTG